ncbi:hypothetical protein [Streptomyces sp. AK02-01A]|uniref:hypothetical protein n=1 Tax=Streptomyces sp. AK02-01A TaxID=3028648 RepID=UPI0029A50A6D|nr:hypothetical protein [Streptomyces sp. AK02-01A]MDX3854465.1 hypothetical protein [Streptomyces sp. AK02-01A]
MTTSVNHTTEHPTHRLDVALPAPYERAVKRYEELVPAADTARFGQLASWQAALDLAEINAPHGFMIYWRTDVTSDMAGSGSGWKCTAYLMGNHTIAERMFRHDPATMLHAPLRTALYADVHGDTRFVVDRPSSLFDSYGTPAITAVGEELDQLLAGLLTLLGATPPKELSG